MVPVKVAPQIGGKILKINVTVGTQVQRGEVLFTMEAMKMEHEMKAIINGIIDSVYIQEGDQINYQQVCMTIVPNAPIPTRFGNPNGDN